MDLSDKWGNKGIDKNRESKTYEMSGLNSDDVRGRGMVTSKKRRKRDRIYRTMVLQSPLKNKLEIQMNGCKHP